ncbi:MAG TPA: hypothetical protein ENI61_03730 [Ignavibacteria bacterium]|nr:hypothetical protein [Ignavibacteria bacterium]
MKRLITLSFFMLTILFLFNGCSGNVNNSIMFKNAAAGNIYVNFRGNLVKISSGNLVQIKNIPQGKYQYVTTYDIPIGVTGSSVSGDVNGTVTINAGTKILVFYSSYISGGIYTLTATKSNNDNQTKNNPVIF